MRDEISIPMLKGLALDSKGFRSVAIRSLGDIGTAEAERALVEIFRAGVSVVRAGAALILCGSPTAVAVVVEHVRERPDGHATLCKMLDGLRSYRGWRAGEYSRPVDDEPIATYIAEYQPTSPKEHWERIHAVEKIDGPAIRALLRSLLWKAGTLDDVYLREDDKYLLSINCRGQLALRGDECVIPYVLDSELQRADRLFSRLPYELRRVSRSAVAEELRRRLLKAEGSSSTKYLIAMLGDYGSAEDGSLLETFVASEDDGIADTAYEARMRLIDPLRMPQRWGPI